MKSFFLLFAALLLTSKTCSAAADKIVLQAEAAGLAPGRVEIVDQPSFQGKSGAALVSAAKSTVDTPDAPPDLVFRVNATTAGRYLFTTRASVDSDTAVVMENAKSKRESIYLRIAVGDSRPVRRVVFVPWSRPDMCNQTTGKFDLTGEDDEVRVWLPKGVLLDSIQISPYVQPAVPAAVATYQPKIVPPPSHPRLWVSAETLPGIRANLTKPENAPSWEKIQEIAAKPVVVEPGADGTMDYNPDLETAAVDKAFVYLMTGERAMGQQSVKIIRDYLDAVEFGNILDITREIGRAIYAGALVYDWCYDLMTPQDRSSIRKNLMRLSDDMEIGWPPFKQRVVNGHGSEAQLLSHLLAMSIAIYDEDPVPYKYCSYRILEELVPMRDFEYQSPRHHQGIGYGIYRFGWDMHAAWLFYRMTGEKVFDANIEDVTKYWLYMRLPNGRMLADGDTTAYDRATKLGSLALLTSAYAKDPYMKREYLNQGGLPDDPVMVLLLNDPDLAPAPDLSALPLTLDFGKIRGGMVARTGWTMSEKSSDVVVEMSGGGYQFANHQHSDAGSFQIYYHGIQVADLGEYLFYGTPYDQGFNKRSISHSMMLAYDPQEIFGQGRYPNDGGTRYGMTPPPSVSTVKNDPQYANGKILSADFGPSKAKPAFSYFSVDLTSAYSNKIRNYVRTFCFLNLENSSMPAALIVLDNMETSGSEVEKFWQINTLNPPQPTADGVLLTNAEGGKSGNVSVQMLLPQPGDRKMQILSGKDSTNVFGKQLTPPQPDKPQSDGHRIMFSPTTPQKTNQFLSVMTMSEAGQTTLSALLEETQNAYIISLADRVVVLSKTGKLISDPIAFKVPQNQTALVTLTGLKPGLWEITKDGKLITKLEAFKNKNTGYTNLSPGQYQVTPAAKP